MTPMDIPPCWNSSSTRRINHVLFLFFKTLPHAGRSLSLKNRLFHFSQSYLPKLIVVPLRVMRELGVMAQAYSLSYLGNRDQEDCGLRPVQVKSS
jgi:hypothetical protein